MKTNLGMKSEKSYTIKDLPFSERPREKIINYGVESLSNAELLAVIIRTGDRRQTAIEVAQNLLKIDNRGLASLVDISLEDLMKVKGIGECKACQILSAIEIGKRIRTRNIHNKIRIDSPSKIVNLMMDELRYLNQEHFKILLLDTKNQIIKIENISVGTLNASIVHPRDVFNAAIKRHANSIILVHNHPSGDPTPSNEDINVTNRLVEVGEIVGIKVLDHIIMGDNRYISFKEKNLI
jgi:DNA repair protein RadC